MELLNLDFAHYNLISYVYVTDESVAMHSFCSFKIYVTDIYYHLNKK